MQFSLELFLVRVFDRLKANKFENTLKDSRFSVVFEIRFKCQVTLWNTFLHKFVFGL